MPSAVPAPRARAAFSPEEQAASLWTFVHLKTPRFTSDVALEVVTQLLPNAGDEVKPLAKRLRQALAARGVAIKHEAALSAASRLLGYDSWHAANRAETPATKLHLRDFLRGDPKDELFADWPALARRLIEICEAYLLVGPECMFHVHLSRNSLAVTVRVSGGRRPVAVAHPAVDGPGWREGAPSALELLRRHLEEIGKATLDGLAVPQLCASRTAELAPDWPGFMPDPLNSELVLRRADKELEQGIEVGRGDEVACWAQFDMAVKEESPEAGVELAPDGAWVAGNGRYVWELHALLPRETAPLLNAHPLNAADSRRLLHRYRLAKKLQGARLRPTDFTRNIEFLRDVPDRLYVKLPALLQRMEAEELTWEAYLKECGQGVTQGAALPFMFALALFKRLDVQDPHDFLAAPPRAELAPVGNDSLLRALLPRVGHLRYRLSAQLSRDVKQSVMKALEDFSTSLQMLSQQPEDDLPLLGGEELPYLVWANEGEELRQKLQTHGLRMFAGVMPHLTANKLSEDDVKSLPPDTAIWPYAAGYSLFLDIDREDAQ